MNQFLIILRYEVLRDSYILTEFFFVTQVTVNIENLLNAVFVAQVQRSEKHIRCSQANIERSN